MMGTANSFLMRMAYTFATLERSLKALPPPATLYRPQQQTGSGPLVWPGWDRYEQEYAQSNNKDLANAKTAVNSTWVFANIQAIANEFSAAELIVKEKQQDGTLEDVEGHDLEELWNSPNPHMGRSFLMAYWAWSYTLVGKAYLYWVPIQGKVREVWPIPAFMLAPIPDNKQFIKGYAFKARQDSEVIVIPPEYITYSHSVNPFDVRDGMSFLVAGMTAIRSDIAASKWNESFFADSNGIPDGLITVPKDTLDTDLTRIRMEIRDFFGGTRRGVAVARAGDLDYKPFGRTQKEAEFLAGRELSSKEIGRLLGFPDGYWSESANRANAEQARATMIAGAVWPLLVRLHEDLNAGVVKRWWGEQYRAEFKDIRPEDRQLKLAEFTAYQAVLTVDELRELIDRDPIGDVRGGMLVAEVAKGTPTPTSKPGQETEDAIAAMEEEADAADAEAGMVEEEPMAEGEPAPMEPVKAAHLRQWETKAMNTLRRKGRATAPFQSEHIDPDTRRAIAAGLVDARTPEGVRAVFAPFSVKKNDSLQDRIGAILRRAEREAVSAIMQGDTPSLEALERELGTALHAALVEEVLSGVGAMSAEFGVSVDASAQAAAWVASYVPGAVSGMTETTKEGLQAAIQAYRTSPMERADLVRMVAGLFGPERAEMIAQTETTRAQAQATTETRKYLSGYGLEYEYVWQTVNADECALCLPLNDQVVGEDNLPPKHPRCRCRISLRRKT